MQLRSSCVIFIPIFQIYIGKIPKEVYEDTLITLFEDMGKIWDLRLMMDPLTGRNRGYAFLTYCDKTSAYEAAKKVIALFTIFQLAAAALDFGICLSDE